MTANAMAVEVARQFIRSQTKHAEPMRVTSSGGVVEVPPMLEGLSPRFRPEALVTARTKGCGEDFTRIRVIVTRAFDPVPNDVNCKSVLFDDSDVGSRLIEGMALSRDRHAMRHNGDMIA